MNELEAYKQFREDKEFHVRDLFLAFKKTKKSTREDTSRKYTCKVCKCRVSVIYIAVSDSYEYIRKGNNIISTKGYRPRECPFCKLEGANTPSMFHRLYYQEEAIKKAKLRGIKKEKLNYNQRARLSIINKMQNMLLRSKSVSKK